MVAAFSSSGGSTVTTIMAGGSLADGMVTAGGNDAANSSEQTGHQTLHTPEGSTSRRAARQPHEQKATANGCGNGGRQNVAAARTTRAAVGSQERYTDRWQIQRTAGKSSHPSRRPHRCRNNRYSPRQAAHSLQSDWQHGHTKRHGCRINFPHGGRRKPAHPSIDSDDDTVVEKRGAQAADITVTHTSG